MKRSTITKSPFLKVESSFPGLAQIVASLSRVKSQRALDCVAREIIEIARRARVSRQRDLYREASSLAAGLPASHGLHSIAQCYSTLSYQALEIDKIREALIRTAGNVDVGYVPRVILETGITYDLQGDLSEAMRHYVEAGRAAARVDALVSVQAAMNIAFVRSLYGGAGATRQLESLSPVVQSFSRVYPNLYYEHLNNLAVALTDTGRIEEARRAVRIALASPLAHRFPEWGETQREIEEAAQKEARRSPATATVILLPAPEAQAREFRAQSTKKAGERFVIPGTDIRKVGAFTPLPFPNGLPVVSLLERYVKTVRIRQP